MPTLKEIGLQAELEELKKTKDEKIAETQYMGMKFGTIGDLVNKECAKIIEEYKGMVEFIRKNP